MNVLIVGGGSIGERHLRCFQQVGTDVGLCEIDDARRSELVERYGVPRAFGSISDAAQRAWDAVVICTPANLHVEHALQLGGAGGAILIEKPLATRLDDVDRLEGLARQKPIEVAYVLRGHPAVTAVRQAISAGELGDLLQVHAVSGQHFPTFRPAYREIYYRDRATGGGAVQDAATHLFDLVQFLAGRFDWVWCDYAHQMLPGVEVEDTVHLIGRVNEQKTMASVQLNQFQAPNETWLQLNGSRASARVEFHRNRWGVFRSGDAEWQWSESLVAERDDLFRLQARNFLEIAAGRAESLCNLASARHTLQVNLAVLESAAQNLIAISRDP